MVMALFRSEFAWCVYVCTRVVCGVYVSGGGGVYCDLSGF